MSSLRKKAVRGVSWTALSSLVLSVLQIAEIAVLARFLDPRDFGLKALVTVVVGFVTAYADMGIGNSIVHRHDTDGAQLSSLYWFNILVSVAAYAVVLAVMPVVVWFYAEPRLYALIPIGAVTFVINSFYGVHFKVLEKQLEFKVIAFAEICGTVTGISTAVAMAIQGYGVLSLLIGQIVTFTVRGVVILARSYKMVPVHLGCRLSIIREHISFGLYQTGERTVSFISRNLDKLIVGRVLGSEILGYYSIAFSLVLMPISRLNPLLTRVAFPVLSAVQESAKRVRYGYLFVVRFLSFVNFPLLIGLMVLADLFAPLFLGDSWSSTIIIIQVLAVVAILRSIGNPANALILARGKVKRGLVYNVVKLIVQIPVLYLASVFWQLNGLLGAILLFQVIVSLTNYMYLVRPSVYISVRDFIGAIGNWLLFSGLMGLSIVVFRLFFTVDTLVMNFFVLVIVGVIVYCVLVAVFARDYLRELRSTLL